MYWLNGYTTLYTEPTPNSPKVRDLLEKSLVQARDEVVLWQEHQFLKVEYTDTKTWTGWVYAGMLEEYVEMLDADCVELLNQTERKDDFEQYVNYHGARQVNLCGEICAAYILELTLEAMLTLWQQKQEPAWKRTFKRFGLMASGIGIPDLLSMFEAAGKKAYPLADAMRDDYLKRSRYTPEWVAGLISQGDVIAGVRIDQSGRLAKSGALHWVVVSGLMRERCGYGTVRVYNPAPNRIEVYSWREFVESARVPYGVYLPTETL